MLIDEFGKSGFHTPNMPHNGKHSGTYRRFVFDNDASNYIGDLFEDITMNDIMKLIQWAKPAFDRMYLEVRNNYLVSNFGIVIEKERWFFLIKYPNAKVGCIPIEWNFNDQNFLSLIPNENPDPEFIGSVESIIKFGIQALLLLASPSTNKQNVVGARSAISRGKRVTYHAYTNVTINLAQAQQVVKKFMTGTRGPNRRHEVRGSWVHFHKSAGCEHTFVARDVANPDPDAPKYVCSKCGQYRTWRKSHARGDAGKGWVSKDYTVTHKAQQKTQS